MGMFESKFSLLRQETFSLYARNHLAVTFPLLLIIIGVIFSRFFLYGTFGYEQALVDGVCLLIAGGVFLHRYKVLKAYSGSDVGGGKMALRTLVVLLSAENVIYLCLFLAVVFNVGHVDFFYDQFLGYLVSALLIVLYASVSASFFPLLLSEVGVIAGFSLVCAASNLHFTENIYAVFTISFVAGTGGAIAFRNWQLTRHMVLQKIKLDAALRASDSARKEKADFIAMLSHEIRTPLNGIMGMIQILRGADIPKEQKESIETIHDCSTSLLNTLNDVLDLSKIEAGKFSISRINFDIFHLLRGIHGLLSGASRQKGLSLSLDIDPAIDKYIHADPNRIQQILMNLVNNALKFTEKGGVEISVSLRDRKWLRFDISDTGCGMPPDALKKLFNAYVQADASVAGKFGGTGLGLSISKNLVELMGGKIGVQSEQGKGSTFWFEIPYVSAIDAQEVPGSGAQEDTASSINPKGIKILIAEDNPINQTVLMKFLEMKGLSFDVVSNGKDAVSASRKEIYDLILMDMQMPELSGPQATREIHAIRVQTH